MDGGKVNRKAGLALLGALALGAGTRPPRGSTYLYTYYDKNGGIIVNNLPPAFVKGRGLILRQVTVGRISLAVSRTEMARVLRSPELIALVDDIATEHGVDPFLARAVIQAESAFYAKARSRAGALGLMQLMPGTAERFGVVDPFDPRQNITGGVKYLRWLMDTFQGQLTHVVAAYNAGENAVARYHGVPPYAETQAYVPRVLDLYNRRLVQPDPRAAGSMALLQKGRGGFKVEESPSSQATPVSTVAAAPAPRVAAPRTPNPIYEWHDSRGRLQISDTPPPKGTPNVRVFGAGD
jgi:hypothetical protein